MTTPDSLNVATRLLDPRFKYTPALATNIAATWKRYGFDPRANEQRRRQAMDTLASSANDAFDTRRLIVVNG
jgi:hypothetical protein